MDEYKPDFNNINAIAYDGDLRDQLKVLHEMLGTDITDIMSEAYQFGVKFTPNAEKILKYMSGMASKLTVALMKAKKNKGTLTPEEQADFDKISSLTTVLGNLQDRLNTVINKVKDVNKLNAELTEDGSKLGEEIMDSQEQFRAIRAGINAYGFLSKDPELAYLFENEKTKKEKDEKASKDISAQQANN